MNVRQKQLLEMLDISRTTLWRMIKRNEFPSPDRINPRVLLWNISEIEAWLSKI